MSTSTGFTTEVRKADHHFPSINSSDLGGRSISLPQEFPSERTILLVAFTREQQHDIDTWVHGLHLEDGKLAWLEMPVIDNPGAIGRWFINSGMRRGIPERETWRHVVTLYTKKADFNAAVGIDSETSIYAMVVDRQGRILESVSGPYTEEAGSRIRRSATGAGAF